MDKRCSFCKYFSAYYIKGYISFMRTDCGHCSELEQTVNKTANCEKWAFHSQNRKRKKTAIIKGLSTAITSINEIQLILEEENRPE